MFSAVQSLQWDEWEGVGCGWYFGWSGDDTLNSVVQIADANTLAWIIYFILIKFNFPPFLFVAPVLLMIDTNSIHLHVVGGHELFYGFSRGP